MHQVYKATDVIDNIPSFFYFDGAGRYTVLECEGKEESLVIAYFKRKGADWRGDSDTRSRMVNPVLIAEW